MIGSNIFITNKFSFSNLITKLIKEFKTRVSADGGTFEAEQCLKDSLPTLIENEPSLLVTPNVGEAGKLFSIIPTNGTGDLDVVRATSATRVNEQGLIEIPRTNLVVRSEEFDNAVWIKSASTITANATTSPNGTMTADKLVENNTNENHYVIQNTGSLVIGNTYFVSVYLKAGERNRGRLRAVGAFAIEIAFNLQNGTVSGANAIIQNVGNGWYKVGFSFIANATTMGTVIFLSNATTGDSGFSSDYLGDNTSGLFIWGAQLEAGNVATEYIPTTSVIRTRFAGITQDGGSASNIPRLDYTNGSCPSILVEPQRTNLITNSNLANNTSGFTKITGQSSPDGLKNASLLTEVALNDQKLVNSTAASILGNTTYAYSVFLKYKGIQNITINATDSISGFARTFDILNGVVVGNSPNTFIIPYPDGWYRCVVIRTTGASAVNGFIQINLGTYLGDGIKGFYWFGVQIEQGSYPTSYIPTTSSAVTRNADVISKTGISSLIGQTEGTLFINLNISKNNIALNRRILSLSDGTTNNRINIGMLGNVFSILARNTSQVVLFLNTISFSLNNNKIIFRYNNLSYSLFYNGNLVSSGPFNSSMFSLFNFIEIGSFQNADFLQEDLKNVSIFPTQLTDQQCIELTTL